MENQSDSDDSFEDQEEFNDQARQKLLKAQYMSNYKKVIETFINYYNQRSDMKLKVQKMKLMEKKIEKVRKSNQYDIREIKQMTNTIVNINKVQTHLGDVKNNLITAQKALQSLKLDKSIAAIRYMQKLKQNNKFIDPFIKQVKEQVQNQVIAEANKKILYWIEQSRKQQTEMGLIVLQSCEVQLQQNASFGRVSIFNPDQRSSIIMRQTMFNNQNVMRNSMRQSVIRQSVIRQSINQSQNRQSIFQQFNTNNNLQNSQIVESQTLQLIESQLWEFDVDFSTLKQPLIIYETLEMYQQFIEQLKLNRQQYLQGICDDSQIHNVGEFRNYISTILGFILMDQEINKQYQEYNEVERVNQTTKQIEKQIKSAFQQIDLAEILIVKKDVQLFSLALSKLKLYQISNQINKTLNDLFIVFCNRRIEKIKRDLDKTIRLDGCAQLVVSTRDQYDMLCNILKIERDPHLKKLELPVSKTVLDIIDNINLFIDGSIQYLQNLNDYYDQNVIFYLDVLFQMISEVFKQYALEIKDFFILCQQTLNFNYVEISLSYFRKQIETLLQVTTTKDFECLNSIKDGRYVLETGIQDCINSKIIITNFDWAPEKPNKGPTDSFQLIISGYQTTQATLQVLLPDFINSSLYLTFKHLNKIIWKSLLDTKYFNILGLVNMQTNLQNLLEIAQQQIFPESIKEFIQFLDLFLVGTPDQYLNPQLRNQKYMYINSQILVKVLSKYKKIEYQKYPVVRKRDVDSVIKEICQNPNAY
ncbi:hypothetical protein pb186bvf_011818 [Paramecium bursaria]